MAAHGPRTPRHEDVQERQRLVMDVGPSLLAVYFQYPRLVIGVWSMHDDAIFTREQVVIWGLVTALVKASKQPFKR